MARVLQTYYRFITVILHTVYVNKSLQLLTFLYLCVLCIITHVYHFYILTNSRVMHKATVDFFNSIFIYLQYILAFKFLFCFLLLLVDGDIQECAHTIQSHYLHQVNICYSIINIFVSMVITITREERLINITWTCFLVLIFSGSIISGSLNPHCML